MLTLAYHNGVARKGRQWSGLSAKEGRNCCEGIGATTGLILRVSDSMRYVEFEGVIAMRGSQPVRSV